MRRLPSLLVVFLIATFSPGTIYGVETPEYDLHIIHHTPSTLPQFATLEVPVLIQNFGSRTWTPDEFNVSYHWLSPEGEMITLDGLRTPIPREVPSGAEIRVFAHLLAPRTTGSFLLQWDVVHESVTWISEKDPTPPLPVPVEIVPGTFSHAFSIVAEDTPRVVWAGETRTVDLTIRNDGTMAWTPDEDINVSYHWEHTDKDRRVFEGERTALPGTVDENEKLALEVKLRTPRAAGLYRLQWDMVHENVTWFSDTEPEPPPTITVLVLPNPLESPYGASIAAILGLALALWVTYHPDGRDQLTGLAVLGDLVWLFFAVFAKQAAIPAAAGKYLLEGTVWIMASGVAAITILVSLLPRRVRPWAVVALNLLFSLLILADVIYLRFFGDVLSLASAGAAGQTGQVVESIRSLLEWQDLWLFGDLVPGIVLATLLYRLAERARTNYRRWFALLLFPFLVPGLLTIQRISKAEEGRFVQVFQNIFVVQEIGPLNYHLLDAWNEARSSLFQRELSDERRQEIVEWFRSRSALRSGAGRNFGIAKGRNLVMIQVESMQGFVIDLEIDGQEVTPNLNRWKRSRALWFSNCSDQTAQGRTSDAEFATQVSLLPLPHGAVAFRFGDNRYEALGDVLAGRGYHTISAIPFTQAFWNRRFTLPEYGFQTTLFRDDFQPGLQVGWGLNDLAFLEQMVPKLSALQTPFAALLITLSNHHPYAYFPDELKELDLGDLEGTSIGNYLHSVHHFDKAFGSFILEMDRANLLEHTVVALWGDHTAGHPWEQDLGDVIGIHVTEPEYYRVAEVPLMIGIPGAGEELVGERTMRCGEVDVTPTLLALLGIDASRYPFIGRNLLGEPAEDQVIGRYGAWLDDELLYLNKGPELEAGRCYQIDSLELLPVERCREGDLRAKEKIRISRDIVLHDLQVPIAEALGAPVREEKSRR